MPKESYDVFLSYNSRDKHEVVTLASKLKEFEISPWLDDWYNVPGTRWVTAVEEALQNSRSCAIFFGQGDAGPWQTEEMQAAIVRRAQDANGKFRIIPVLLPGAKKRKQLPPFLTGTTWVEFNESIDDSKALDRLVAGIKRRAPQYTTQPHGRVNVVIEVDGTVEQFEKVTEAAQLFLRKTSGDPRLIIKYRRSGSVLITVECSIRGARALRYLHRSGQLKSIEGFPIKAIRQPLPHEMAGTDSASVAREYIEGSERDQYARQSSGHKRKPPQSEGKQRAVPAENLQGQQSDQPRRQQQQAGQEQKPPKFPPERAGNARLDQPKGMQSSQSDPGDKEIERKKQA
jgi:hypothetical protein